MAKNRIINLMTGELSEAGEEAESIDLTIPLALLFERQYALISEEG